MNKLFDRIFFHNNTTPALNESNLNSMSKAIDDIDTRVVEIAGNVLVVVPQIEDYLEQAQALVQALTELSQNPPYIGANGNWYIFDTNTEQYVDSGVDASITVSIADIEMLGYDDTPYVTNTGTDTDPIFHLFIPRAATVASVRKTSTSGNVDTYTMALQDGSEFTFEVKNGDGFGDMTQADYDPDDDVVNAGGIPKYLGADVAQDGEIMRFNSNTERWSGAASCAGINKLSGALQQGISTMASGENSHAEGAGSCAHGGSSHAEGQETKAIGVYAHSEGRSTCANGSYSHAEGNSTCANGNYSHAEGSQTTANGVSSHAEGSQTYAVSQGSHSEGQQTTAFANFSHAEGFQTNTCSGAKGSHAEGFQTCAYADYSHAEGNGTCAAAKYSHAEGKESKTYTMYSHAMGNGGETRPLGDRYDYDIKTLFAIGGSMYDLPDFSVQSIENSEATLKKNAVSVDEYGNIFLGGAPYYLRGCIKGRLVANGDTIVLEDGAMYVLHTHARYANGGVRGVVSYVISATFNTTGLSQGIGTSTTGNAAPLVAQIGATGTTGVSISRLAEPYLNSAGTTSYHSKIGIGACTTACHVRYSLMKVCGSNEDFTMDWD